MSRHKKERKLKQKQKKETENKDNNIKYDVLNILLEEKYDTKPNLGKLLKTYVKSIRISNYNKIELYPVFGYTFNKIFIKFLDGHELICEIKEDGVEFYMYYGTDECFLTDKEKLIVSKFYDALIQFKFVF